MKRLSFSSSVSHLKIIISSFNVLFIILLRLYWLFSLSVLLSLFLEEYFYAQAQKFELDFHFLYKHDDYLLFFLIPSLFFKAV